MLDNLNKPTLALSTSESPGDVNAVSGFRPGTENGRACEHLASHDDIGRDLRCGRNVAAGKLYFVAAGQGQ